MCEGQETGLQRTRVKILLKCANPGLRLTKLCSRRIHLMMQVIATVPQTLSLSLP